MGGGHGCPVSLVKENVDVQCPYSEESNVER